ncbi:MAG: hypothetical protein VB080_06055 [Propionicimonas sp.]|uniref:hypothetical protein n=1 Tax=Propionicimonas sp. TaxID=1955623 RepID=UPI002B209A43|nr:hypothetical protein [Propionicimonas sp.]MEA4943988.1 hypothetical protein [Propionicimonas sp.]
MPAHPQVRLLAATVSLLNVLDHDRTRFGALIGSAVPDGWPEFPEAIGFALEQLQQGRGEGD